ncbi:1-phosphofructokinase family hexose kinase [Nocardioides sp.]|uniref:1-phosphofructokinase family hexose kinase n=1 Tax=Nocardioides sp. TaxID=35761 RepID=UPI002725C3A9|nr:1-phosphofructokinase family hexose kinase [Nocardioides sp.]MDO9456974.1 1-phosphofructokinase family hexose kinase [Nocardioides sp.]
MTTSNGTSSDIGRIVTLTPNPSTDRTIELAGPLRRGAVQRTSSVLDQAGGKGVNISRACLAAGVPTTAVLPAAADDPFVLELEHAGVHHRLVTPDGPVRVNVTISEPDGTTTKLNSPGATATPGTLTALADALHELAADAAWVVLAGSLPPGAPAHWYADLVADLRTLTRVAVDTSEAPLQALVDRLTPGSAPHLMKPNGEELASFTGGDADTIESDPQAAADAARTLLDRGVTEVLATLGGHGAVLVTADGAWHATPPPTEVVSTVGAGDSSLFGYLLGGLRGQSPADRLALAVAYGSAAAGLPGTTIPQPAQARPHLVVVRELAVSPSTHHHTTPGARA